MNELENPFICGIYDDYEYCLNNDAFISCKSLLEEIINEATWDNANNNKYRHYVKHVCKDDENFTGQAYDSFDRIKFPNMSFGKYLTAAEKLADTSPVQEEPSEEKVFGWKAYVGWIKKVACIKFKQSNLKDKEGNPLYEYVAYTPILGEVVEKELDSGAKYKYHKILDRLIFSYGLTDNPDNFKKIDSLSLDELTESLDIVRITESILNEANRQQLLQKSRKAKNYVPSNQYKGRNRFERRTKSSISATVRDYNMIQMDPLFKRDILEFKIPVMGETDVYVVDVRVDGLLAEIRKQLMANKGTLEFKVVLQSLMKVLNIGNVYIGCNCLHPDTKIKLLDGTTPTVKEMCERFEAGETLWVYSTDENGDFKPGQVERVWKTGEATDFIKITLDNGEEIITTPEHPYMLRDGTYAFACDLKEGQLLMPMYFSLNHKIIKVEKISLDYTPVYDIKVKEWENFVVDAGVVLHNCPDARYRMAYNQTKNDYKAGYKERRPSNITNPLDDLGAGCKHVLLVLANLDWAVKVASVINNYIKYCKEHLQRNYADYIFPKIYGVKYDKAVQLNLFDNGLFPEDQKTMDTVIGQGFRGKDNKGKFVPGNEFRFQKKEPEEQPEEEPENPLDLKFHKGEEPEEESPETES